MKQSKHDHTNQTRPEHHARPPRHERARLSPTETGADNKAADQVQGQSPSSPDQAPALIPAADPVSEQLQSIATTAIDRDKSLRQIAQSISANLTNPAYYHQLAEAMRRQGDLRKAKRLYERALTVDPKHVESCLGMARLHSLNGDAAEADKFLQRAGEIDPANVEILLFAATEYERLDRPESAELRIRQAYELAPADPVVLVRLAEIERRKGHVDTSLSLLDEALAVDSCDAAARYGRGMLALQQGEWSYGWREFEWRWRSSAVTRRDSPPCKLWDGGPLKGKQVFIRGDRNLADNLMFASCLHEVVQQADRCVIEVNGRLNELFRRTFSPAKCVTRGQLRRDEFSQFDCWSPLASLPRYLRESPSRFPGTLSPLVTNESWKSLHARNLFDLGKGLKVGVSWRGISSPHQTVKTDAKGKRKEAARRETTLADWKPVLDVAGIHLINLQGPESEEEFQEALELHPRAELCHWDHVRPHGDLDDLASLVTGLDLVISVPNRVAHLAGALGVPTWTVLSDWPSWRWGLVGAKSPWYPTMTLFRTKRPGEWRDAFQAMAKELSLSAKKKDVFV